MEWGTSGHEGVRVMPWGLLDESSAGQEDKPHKDHAADPEGDDGQGVAEHAVVVASSIVRPAADAVVVRVVATVPSPVAIAVVAIVVATTMMAAHGCAHGEAGSGAHGCRRARGDGGTATLEGMALRTVGIAVAGAARVDRWVRCYRSGRLCRCGATVVRRRRCRCRRRGGPMGGGGGRRGPVPRGAGRGRGPRAVPATTTAMA